MESEQDRQEIIITLINYIARIQIIAARLQVGSKKIILLGVAERAQAALIALQEREITCQEAIADFPTLFERSDH